MYTWFLFVVCRMKTSKSVTAWGLRLCEAIRKVLLGTASDEEIVGFLSGFKDRGEHQRIVKQSHVEVGKSMVCSGLMSVSQSPSFC